MSKLDDIIAKWLMVPMDYPGLHPKPNYDTAKEEFKRLMLEIIGEDYTNPGTWRYQQDIREKVSQL